MKVPLIIQFQRFFVYKQTQNRNDNNANLFQCMIVLFIQLILYSSSTNEWMMMLIKYFPVVSTVYADTNSIA